MSDMQHTDLIIVGAGLAGLIAALHYNDLCPNSDILVLDKQTFPIKAMNPIVLDPISRNMLHTIKSYKDYDFNEGRYRTYSLVNYSLGIHIKSEDTAILPYSNLTYVLYSIGVLNNIPIHLKSEVISIDYDNKYITLDGDVKISFNSIVDATGVHAKAKTYNIDWYSPVIDEDQDEYSICVSAKPASTNFSVLQPINSNCPNPKLGHIAIGDAGGYVDFLTYCSANLAIVSGLTSAEVLAEGAPVEEYYKRMSSFKNHVLGSIACRNKIPTSNEEFCIDLADVLLHGDMSYGDIYNKYVRVKK